MAMRVFIGRLYAVAPLESTRSRSSAPDNSGLRLVLPAVARRQLAHELGRHRRERDDRGGHDTQTRLSRMRRVAVTGGGAVTPLGLDVPSTSRAAQAGEGGVDGISTVDTEGLPARVAGAAQHVG